MGRSKARVAVIGCGYVGMAVGRALFQAGHSVTGTTTTVARVTEIAACGIDPVVLDVADVTRLRAVLGTRDVVILSAGAGRGRRDYRSVYLDGVTNVLAAVSGTPVTRLIYTSSTRVYGQDDGSAVTETSPTVPGDDEGQILLDAERTWLAGAARTAAFVARDRAKRLTATVLRLGGIYGPGRDPRERIAAVAGQTREDGNVYVNLVHVDDIVAALVRLVSVPYHGVLNLCDDRPVLRRVYYDALLREAGLAAVEWQGAAEEAPRGKQVSNALIKRVLGLVLRHPAAGP